MISYINNLCSNLPTYTSLPSTRVLPLIIWNRTNGRWIMRWDSDAAAWVPFYGIGDTTVYISTTGTNSQGYGDGTGSNAFSTLNYAWINTPHAGDGKITYIVATGTYVTSSTTYFCKKEWNQTIIEGEYTVDLTGTVSANAAGHAGTVTHTGGGLTTNAHSNKIMVFDDFTIGTLEYSNFVSAIRSNTTTVFTLEYTPSGLVNASTTYSVVSPGTIFDSSGSTTVASWMFNSYVKIIKCKFKMHSIRFDPRQGYIPAYAGVGIEYYGYGAAIPNNLHLFIIGCFFESTYTNYTLIIDTGILGMFGCVYTSSYTTGGPDSAYFILARFGCFCYVYATRCTQTAGTKVNAVIYSYIGKSRMYFLYSSCDNFSVALNTAHGGCIYIDQATITNCTTGVNAQNNGTVYTGTMTYSGNTTNEATATSGIMV